jgi:hypothetical protein
MAAITTPTLIQPGEVVNGGLLKATPLNARFDLTLIAPHIADAERLHVVPAICAAFYDALITKKSGAISNYNTSIGPLVQAFPDVGDEAYETLWVKHLAGLCAWAVYYEALPFIVMQTGTNGVYVPQGDKSQAAGVSGAKFLQDTALRRLRALQDVTREYLCANADSFEDFCKTDICTGCDDTAPEGDTLSRYGIFYSVD